MAESVQPVGNPPCGAAHADQIRAYLDALTASPAFTSSPRRTKLLRYLVEKTLAGNGEQISEYGMGLDVFDKPSSFDQRIESVVRNEVSRLRKQLKEYYAGEGRGDRIVIDIPMRSYCPVFEFRDVETSPARSEPAPILAPVPPARHWKTVILWAGLALGVAAAGLVLWRVKNPSPGPLRSLAVLPFQNLSPQKENEYLADGMTEELTNDFAQWKDLRVVARTSASQFKGKAVDVREIGRRLNVDAILEGSFAKQGDRIRITAQLNRTSDGYHLWSKAYDARSGDVLGVQQEISQAIAATVRSLGQKLPEPAIHPTTTNLEAHDLYLRGSYVLSLKNTDSLTKGLALLEQAVNKDPNYAMAYLQIADTEFALLAAGMIPPDEGPRRIKTALENAIRADPRCAEAHGMMAGLIHSQDWDWPRAEAEFKLAIEQGAGAVTHSLYGWSLTTQGRFAEALTQLEIAQDLNPLGTGQRMNEASLFIFQRRYGDARNTINGLLREHPDMASAHGDLTTIAALERDCDAMQSQVDWEYRVDPKADLTLDRTGVSACRGDEEPSRRYLSKIAASAPPQASFDLAEASAYVHETNLALSFLEKAADAKISGILNMRVDPVFDGIRNEPRFIALEKRLGLQP